MTAFTIFGIEIKWYAIIIVCGMIAGMMVCGYLFKRRGYPFDSMIDFAIIVLPLAIIGARCYYVIFSADSYAFWSLFTFWEGMHWAGILVGLIAAYLLGCVAIKINPFKLCRIMPSKEGDKLKPQGAKDIVIMSVVALAVFLFLSHFAWLLFSDADRNFYKLINTRQGGLALYGGALGGLAGMLIVCRFKKYNFRQVLQILDCAAASIIIGQVIGRWGNFVNQEAYGQRITDAVWQWFPFAVHIDAVNSVDGAAGWFQATFFYESMLNLIGFFLLFFIGRKNHLKAGLNTCGYFVWYGLVRSYIEGFRTDSLYNAGGFRVSQLLSTIFVLGGLVVAMILVWKNCNKNERIAGCSLCGIAGLGMLVWMIGQFVTPKIQMAPVLAAEFLLAGCLLILLRSIDKLPIAGLIGGITFGVGVLFIFLSGAPVWTLAFLALPLGYLLVNRFVLRDDNPSPNPLLEDDPVLPPQPKQSEETV